MPAARRQLVFVCTGNTCRSPMAERMMRKLLPVDSGWQVGSAGVAAGPGAPASELAVRVMQEKQFDLSDHSSRPVDAELVANTDLFITMTRAHRDLLRHHFGVEADKVRTLHAYGQENPHADVMDPFGGGLDTYRLTRDEIEAALMDVILSLPEFR